MLEINKIEEKKKKKRRKRKRDKEDREVGEVFFSILRRYVQLGMKHITSDWQGNRCASAIWHCARNRAAMSAN